MIPHVKKQELAANNLSNASTPGYKKDILFTRELSVAQARTVGTKSDWQRPMVSEVYTNFHQGIFDKTGNPLDMAIDGDGFFQLQTDTGEQILTRSGSFIVNRDGLLAFPGGAIVMGEGGAIEIGTGTVSVAVTGEVQVDGIQVGRIQPVTTNNLDNLEKLGGSAYGVPEGTELIPVRTSTIVQGFLEQANVDVVSEMINMIASYRSFEANAKAVETQDQTLSHLFHRVTSGG